MKTTVFDLIWKLKRALEKQGHEKIDLHRFTHEKAYRKEILLNTDISELPMSQGLQEIYNDLLDADELELIKEIEVPDKPPVEKEEKPEAAPLNHLPENKSSYKPVYISVSIIAILLFAFSFIQFSSNSEVTPNTIATDSNVNETQSVQPAATAKKDKLADLASDRKSTSDLKSDRNEIETAQRPDKAQSTSVINNQEKPVTAEIAPPKPKTIFRIQGSNTIGEVLAPELIKAFYISEGALTAQLVKGNHAVEKRLEITYPDKREVSAIPIHAHGSSTGFKALSNNETELAMASRRIKDKELKLLNKQYGNLRSKNTEHIIGMDGLAIIINPSNPIESLSIEQLAKLFSGNISNWQELGGNDEAVKIFARDSNSGTWDSFKSMVLKKFGVKLAPTAARIESSVELSDSVSKTQGAIGFIGLPYVLRAKALAISDGENGQPIYPTSFTISTEDYPLVRRLYIYEPNTIGTQSDAHRFISFALSKAGQDVVKKAGFISQNIYQTRPVLTDTLPQKYIGTVKDAQRLSLNFRFNSGTFTLDNKAERDLERLIQFFETHPGKQAMLIGFSDSIGETAGNQALSLQRAKAVEKALLARGINIQRTIGLGEMAPIASNQTKIGRERNRRVEIWVNSENQGAYNTATR